MLEELPGGPPQNCGAREQVVYRLRLRCFASDVSLVEGPRQGPQVDVVLLPLHAEADDVARVVSRECLVWELLNFDYEVGEDLVQVPTSDVGLRSLGDCSGQSSGFKL